MKLNYFGLLRSPVSWAKIGREIINGFTLNGHEVNVVERKGFLYSEGFGNRDSGIANQPSTVNRQSATFLQSAPTLTFEYPLNYRLIPEGRKIGMLVYETGEVPKEWVKNINGHLEMLFLPNDYNKEIFVNSGVNPDIIRVVPYGVNGEYYYGTGYKVQGTEGSCTLNPAPCTPGSPFTFLCVAMPQKRKGIDTLIKAFEKAFGGSKEALLKIKFPYKPGKSKYDINLNDLKTKANVEFITDEMNETQMGELYRSCDSLVLASRAEGFGMCYLEALACKKPVIATGWGGHMSFLNEKNALLVKYSLVDAGPIQYDNPAGAGKMAEPDLDDLAEKLRHMITDYDIEWQKAAAFDAAPWAWRNITRKMADDLIIGV